MALIEFYVEIESCNHIANIKPSAFNKNQLIIKTEMILKLFFFRNKTILIIDKVQTKKEKRVSTMLRGIFHHKKSNATYIPIGKILIK